MENYINISRKNLSIAKKIIKDLKINEILEKNDCVGNLIGSVATDLLVDNLDIDFHIYPRNFCIENIYKIIGKISTNENIVKTNCIHTDLNTEYKALDWHLYYKDKENRIWRLDLIFLKAESQYAWKAEKIVEKINKIKTLDQINNILRLKYELKNKKIEYMGIEVYKAVFENKIKTTIEFETWKNSEDNKNIDLWNIE